MQPEEQYPDLFAPARWGSVAVQFVRLDEPPPAELIANVNIAAYTAGGWLLLELTSGLWEIPGGTREPGESWQDALMRELLEETGARLVTRRVIGAWACVSSAERPYRPHLPHPRFFRCVLLGQALPVGRPQRPPGGEDVKAVHELRLAEVVERLRGINRPDLADLYRLAAALRAAGEPEA